MSQEKDPFVLPTEPKNSWQTLGWFINEPTLLLNYSGTLSKKETLFQFLKMYFTVIVPLILFIYLVDILYFQKELHEATSIINNYFSFTVIENLCVGLFVSLVAGLICVFESLYSTIFCSFLIFTMIILSSAMSLLTFGLLMPFVFMKQRF